jgi:hypothetical protein
MPRVALAPALNLLPPAMRDRPGRPPVMIAAHLVYGVLTAVVTDRLLARIRVCTGDRRLRP